MISFIDLSSQQKRIRPQLEAALIRVLDHGGYIMGPEVYELEKQLVLFLRSIAIRCLVRQRHGCYCSCSHGQKRRDLEMLSLFQALPLPPQLKLWLG
jgi:hypothetical protein